MTRGGEKKKLALRRHNSRSRKILEPRAEQERSGGFWRPSANNGAAAVAVWSWGVNRMAECAVCG